MRILLSSLIAIFMYVIPSNATGLKIMSWNIANLASQNGVALRDNSHIRTDEGFDLIASVIANADADIIALQEIGSKTAAERVLGDGYHVVMESRCKYGCSEDQETFLPP